MMVLTASRTGNQNTCKKNLTREASKNIFLKKKKIEKQN